MRLLIYDPKQKQNGRPADQTKKLQGGISQRLSHIFLKYVTDTMLPSWKGQILNAK